MPGFKLFVTRICLVNGDLHHHVHLLAKRGDDWCVCGVLVLHSEEWNRLCLVCEVVSIPIEHKRTLLAPAV